MAEFATSYSAGLVAKTQIGDNGGGVPRHALIIANSVPSPVDGLNYYRNHTRIIRVRHYSGATSNNAHWETVIFDPESAFIPGFVPDFDAPAINFPVSYTYGY